METSMAVQRGNSGGGNSGGGNSGGGNSGANPGGPAEPFGRPITRSTLPPHASAGARPRLVVLDLDRNAAATFALVRLLEGGGCAVAPASSSTALAQVLADSGSGPWSGLVILVRNRLAWLRLVIQRTRGIHGQLPCVAVVRRTDVARAQVALAGTSTHLLAEEDLSAARVTELVGAGSTGHSDTLARQDSSDALGALHRVLQGRPYVDALRRAVARGSQPDNPDSLTAAQVADLENLAQLLSFL